MTNNFKWRWKFHHEVLKETKLAYKFWVQIRKLSIVHSIFHILLETIFKKNVKSSIQTLKRK